jgi:ADP-L-glycero-D-manno-heptose 6-epimerase
MILITGANGFIGSALAADICTWNSEPIVACDFVTPAERPELLRRARAAQFVHAEKLFSILPQLQPSLILHIGACSSTTETNWDYLLRVNLQFSQTLFDYCTRTQIPFLYASSAAVYGDGQKGFSDESTSVSYEPLNLYGTSKYEFDRWILSQTRRPPRWYGFRYFNVFGPNEYFKGPMASVVFKAYKQIQETGSMNLFKSHRSDYADGEQKRDFVYIKDVVRWTREFIERPALPNGIYNFGYGTARTWKDLALCLFKAMGRPTTINWIDIPENIRNQYQYFTEAPLEKLKRAGASNPEWNLERAVSDYVGHYLTQSDPYY